MKLPTLGNISEPPQEQPSLFGNGFNEKKEEENQPKLNSYRYSSAVEIPIQNFKIKKTDLQSVNQYLQNSADLHDINQQLSNRDVPYNKSNFEKNAYNSMPRPQKYTVSKHYNQNKVSNKTQLQPLNHTARIHIEEKQPLENIVLKKQKLKPLENAKKPEVESKVPSTFDINSLP